MANLKKVIATIEKAVDRLGKSVNKKQQRLFNALLVDLKELDTKGDTLVNSLKNLALINKIRVKLEKLMVDEKYQAELKKFAGAYSSVTEFSREHFAGFSVTGQRKALINQLHRNAIETTLTNLTETGLQVGVTDGIKKILATNIAAGGSYADMVEQLRVHMLGLPEHKKEGAFERYVKAYANTAINQFSAEYNQAIADDLGLEWYMFDGSLLETSREFCVKAVHKKYIHVSEFDALLRGDFGKHGKIPVSKKTGLPDGMMKGTNEMNLVRRRGGWNCGHQMIAVDAIVVPNEIKEAVANTPAYKLWLKKMSG